MRRILESEAAAKAASRITDETINRLESLAQRYRSATDDVQRLERWVQLDDQFHASIAAVCGSRRLQADIQRYRLLHRVVNRTHTDVHVLARADEEHARILAALRRGDAGDARQAMNDHIAAWQAFFVRHLKRT
jgi:DNA-binding GntR family transcriptional regulator